MEVKEMTIEDVLKTPLFFENVKRQLTSLWNDREKARKDATRNNTRLRAHVRPYAQCRAVGTGKFRYYFRKSVG